MSQLPRNRLRKLREAAGISRTGLADHVGVGEHQVRRWEAEEVLIPTKHFAVLTAKFEVTVDHLLGMDRSSAEQEKAMA